VARRGRLGSERARTSRANAWKSQRGGGTLRIVRVGPSSLCRPSGPDGKGQAEGQARQAHGEPFAESMSKRITMSYDATVPKSVKQKAEAVFKRDANEYEYANEFLSAVRVNWQATENSITRTSVFMVGISFVFEFIISSRKPTTATFLGFNLSASGFVKLALPVLIAYLYYQVTSWWVETLVFELTHEGVLSAVYPLLRSSDIRLALEPSNSLIGSASRLGKEIIKEGARGRLVNVIGAVRALFIAFIPPVFVGYAYFQLFNRPGISLIAFLISAAIGGLTLLCGCYNMYFLIFPTLEF
jgi:hypothetical protein